MRQLLRHAIILCLFMAACGPNTPGASRNGPQSSMADDVSAPYPETERFVLIFLGDSLTAGYGLSRDNSLPSQLQALLDAQRAPIEVRNAGVSSDTSAQGLARFDWSVPADADGVIIEFGANEMFQGRRPEDVRADLAAIIAHAKARRLWIGLVGMKAPVNAGPSYRRAFDRLYPDLAREHGLELYPFYFDGLIDPQSGAFRPELFLPDGLHPTESGVAIVANGMATWLERALPSEAFNRGAE